MNNSRLNWLPFPRHYLRYVILGITLMAGTFLFANNIAFNFSVICIVRPQNTSLYAAIGNEHDPKERFYHDFSVPQRNLLFSAAALGALISGAVFTHIMDAIGARFAFTLCGLLSTVATLLMPAAVGLGFWPTFIVRMIVGSMASPQLIICSKLTHDWSTVKGSGNFLVLLSSQYQIAPIYIMPVSGLLCESHWGWPAIYYLQGVLTFFIFGMFFLLFRDKPSQHPWITNKELKSIMRDKTTAENGTNGETAQKVPYKRMLTDPVVWLVLITFWADDMGYLVFTLFGAIYLNQVIGLDIRGTGFLAALPFLFSLVAKFIAGPINDHLLVRNERIRINIFSTLNQLGMAFCFLALTFLPQVPNVPFLLIQFFYISVNIFSGLDFLGVLRSGQRISQQFAPTIFAWEILFSSMSVLLLPLVVSLMAPNSRAEEWGRILTGIALFELITFVLFICLCDSNPRKWTKVQSNLKGKNSPATAAEEGKPREPKF